MAPRLPRVTAERLARHLAKAGFRIVRQSGSHRIYEDPEGRRVTLPYHSGRVLPPKTFKAILRDAGLDPEDL